MLLLECECFGRNQARHAVDELLHRDRPGVALPVDPDGDRTGLAFTVPDDEHEGDLLQLPVADLVADLFAALVELPAHAGGLSARP